MEDHLGITTFATKSEGIGGVIKQRPEDFYVEEVSRYPPPSGGKHVIARVTARNWETHRLIEHLASSLHIPPEFIGYAGIKDKRAVTTQLMSFPASIERVQNIHLADVTIDILYRSARPVYPGELVGNRFSITIRNVEGDGDAVRSIMEEIQELGFFPNFFGVQRFGIMRPITHVVGKYLLKNEMERAVMTYIANPLEGESEESHQPRKFLEETGDFSEALHRYPEKLAFERRVIQYLATHPGEWKEALFQLPKNLIRMFLHAYQSYLFNRILSARMEEGLSFCKAYEGDIVIPCDTEIEVQRRDGIRVTRINLRKINHQIGRHRCFPSGAIIGYDTMWAEGEMGALEKKILEEERISEQEFTMPHLPDFACRGLRRITAVPLKTVKWDFDGTHLHLEFFLPKGCYATTVLREIMKADVTHY